MVTVSFNLRTPVVASSATAVLWCYCRVRVAAAAAVVGVALAFCGRCSTKCRVFSLPCLVCLSACLFGWALGLSGPVFISSLFGGSSGCSPDSAPSPGAAHVARCQHGSTMRYATMSCVCSTRGTPRALNSHFLVAPPGPQLLFLAQLVLPEHSLLSRSS